MQRLSRVRLVRVGLVAALLLVIAGLIQLRGHVSRQADEAGSSGSQQEANARAGIVPFEGLARGFPVLRDADGTKRADGDFVQWLDGERLHVEISYDFGHGRSVEEKAVFRQRPELTQEQWSFREIRDGELFRDFTVNFASGAAAATKRGEDAKNDADEWSADLEIEPGRTFAGFGFTLAIKALRERLVKGEELELQAVGFTPQPRLVDVSISHAGLEQMQMGGRVLTGNRFEIQPQIPWIARLFVTVPDTQIWLTHPPPAAFLRWQGPLAEPDDPIVRVDLLPGDESGPARPVQTSRR